MVGVQVVFKQNVIEGDDLQIKGIGGMITRSCREFGKRLLCFRVAKLRNRTGGIAAIEQILALLFPCVEPFCLDLPE